jgi:hypothetical protein
MRQQEMTKKRTQPILLQAHPVDTHTIDNIFCHYRAKHTISYSASSEQRYVPNRCGPHGPTLQAELSCRPHPSYTVENIHSSLTIKIICHGSHEVTSSGTENKF